MEWLCECGKPVETLECQWVWRDASAIGQRRGRYVCYSARIGCGNCVQHRAENGYQYFQVKLTAQTKQALVGQVLGQILHNGPSGYVPKTDIQKALRNVQKGD